MNNAIQSTTLDRLSLPAQLLSAFMSQTLTLIILKSARFRSYEIIFHKKLKNLKGVCEIFYCYLFFFFSFSLIEFLKNKLSD